MNKKEIIFCDICNNRMIRDNNGKLICRLGHIKIDNITKYIKNREKEKLRERLIFPNNLNEVIILRLKNPYEQPSGFRREVNENTPTFNFYEFLSQLENKYSPKKLRRIKGNPYNKGKIENKYGLIICLSNIIQEIKEQIEGFILEDGKHFTLEEIQITEQDLKDLIEEERKKILEKEKN